jgi:hypothetical protein
MNGPVPLHRRHEALAHTQSPQDSNQMDFVGLMNPASLGSVHR